MFPYLTCGFPPSLRSNRSANHPTLYDSYLKKISFWINMMVQKISRKMQVLVWEENPMLVSLIFFIYFLLLDTFFCYGELYVIFSCAYLSTANYYDGVFRKCIISFYKSIDSPPYCCVVLRDSILLLFINIYFQFHY